MSLETTINNDIKAAMRAKDKATLRELRSIKQAILLAKTEKGASGELSQEQEIKLLAKLLKQRKDSLRIYEEQGRADLAQNESEGILTIQKYLPEPVSEAELRAIIGEIITQTGASSPKDMGKVMGMALKKLSGKTDGKTISSLVRELLQNN